MNAGDHHSGEVRLVVPARTESLALVRQAAAGAADAIGMTDRRAADLLLLATEASTNVVRHACGDHDGHDSTSRPAEFELEIEPTDGCARLIVRDHGRGFAPTFGGESFGFGIPIMVSVSRSLELRSVEGDGVEVRAEIPVSDIGSEPAAPVGADELPSGAAARVRTRSGWWLRSVLTHLIELCAARAGLSTGESADALTAGDAMSSAVTWDEPTEVTLRESDGRAELTVGPQPENGSPALIELKLTLGRGAGRGTTGGP